MRASRALAACLLLVASGALTSSCVAVLGLDEKRKDPVQELCKCTDVSYMFDGSYDACVGYFKSRLDAASEPARATWMKTWDSTCAGSCTSWDQCVKLDATCTLEGDCKDKPRCADGTLCPHLGCVECATLPRCRDCCNGSVLELKCKEG